jgi:hypothetical protein
MAATWRLVVPWMRVSAQVTSQLALRGYDEAHSSLATTMSPVRSESVDHLFMHLQVPVNRLLFPSLSQYSNHGFPNSWKQLRKWRGQDRCQLAKPTLENERLMRARGEPHRTEDARLQEGRTMYFAFVSGRKVGASLEACRLPRQEDS